MKDFTLRPQKVVVVGDAFVSPETMEQAVRASALCCGEIRKLRWGQRRSVLFLLDRFLAFGVLAGHSGDQHAS